MEGHAIGSALRRYYSPDYPSTCDRERYSPLMGNGERVADCRENLLFFETGSANGANPSILLERNTREVAFLLAFRRGVPAVVFFRLIFPPYAQSVWLIYPLDCRNGHHLLLVAGLLWPPEGLITKDSGPDRVFPRLSDGLFFLGLLAARIPPGIGLPCIGPFT